ncbi:MAG: ATP-binding protein [Candidatus Methanomethylicaceae archaeon]
MLKCHYCSSESSTYIKYAKMHLCKEHFINFIDRKIESSLKRYKMLEEKSKLLLAISGGKDSIVMLNSLSKLKLNILALYLDLGLGNYSNEAKKICEEITSILGVNFITISLKDLIGIDLPSLAKKAHRPYCSVCGIVKRYLLNIAALYSKVDKIAMGHHLDDLLTFIFKNFIIQRMEDISKLGPKTESMEGLIGRIRPLYEVSEEETRLYVEFSNLPYLESKCPYMFRGDLEILLRDFINKLEDNFPGIKISMIRYIAKNINKFKIESKWSYCKNCGHPSISEYCSFCKITKKAIGEMYGNIVKEKIAKIISYN